MNSLYFLLLFNNCFERINLVFVYRLQAEHNIAVHLNKTAVGIVHKARVIGLLHQALGNLIVETQVEDRVHHPRHRCTGARSDRHEKRILQVAELRPHRFLHLADRFFYIGLERLRIRLFISVVVGTYFC